MLGRSSNCMTEILRFLIFFKKVYEISSLYHIFAGSNCSYIYLLIQKD
jgi:hypothetical protein